MTKADHSDLLGQLLPELKGSRMLILGAGGVGRATAIMAHKLGIDIAVANRSQPKLDTLKSELKGLRTYTANVRQQESIDELLNTETPDHIVLTTGRVQPFRSGSTDLTEAMDYVGDRLEPILALANWIANSDKKPKSLTIVSGYTSLPMIGNMAWAAVGPAVKGMVEYLAVELGPTRVNTISPGPIVDTEMANNAAGSPERAAKMTEVLGKQLPIGRPVVSEDVAREILSVAGSPIITASTRFAEGGLAFVPSTLISDIHKEH